MIDEEVDNNSLEVLDTNLKPSKERDNIAKHSKIVKETKLMHCHFITFCLTLIIEEKHN